jgi:hypothetical protein
VARASFFNATARTLDGYLGLLFRREPSVSLPAALQALTTDIDLRGSALVGHAKRVCSEVISMGRCGTLVEWNEEGGEPRPFVAFYEAENIVNWRVARVDGRMVPVLVVLAESFVGWSIPSTTIRTRQVEHEPSGMIQLPPPPDAAQTAAPCPAEAECALVPLANPRGAHSSPMH